MELTTEELEAIHGVLYDQFYYGQELMYEDNAVSRAVSSALAKIEAERERRRRSASHER